MEYFTTTSKPSRRAVDCVIIGVFNRNVLGNSAAEIDAASGGEIRRLIKSGDISSKLGSCSMLPGLPGVKAKRIAVVGLGKKSDLKARQFRKAVAAAAAAIARTRAKQILNCLTLEDVGGASPYYLSRHSTQVINEALYRFTRMKSGRKPRASSLSKVGLSIAKRGDAAQSKRGAEHGDAIAAGVSVARELGNLPANVCTPSYLAREATKLAKGNGKLTTRIVNEPEMKRLGMGSLLSVTAGTDEPAKLIVMQYKGGGSEKPVALVGKGVTFDSGGISLKPGPSMDEMKFDMCGAAGVIGTMAAVAKMRLPINLVVIVPAVENLPSGNATKPGDIVKSMSGQTADLLEALQAGNCRRRCHAHRRLRCRTWRSSHWCHEQQRRSAQRTGCRGRTGRGPRMATAAGRRVRGATEEQFR
jgi:leucyl aminopeptidase